MHHVCINSIDKRTDTFAQMLTEVIDRIMWFSTLLTMPLATSQGKVEVESVSQSVMFLSVERERNESSKQSSTQVSTLTRIAPQRLLVHALSTIKYMKVVVSSINLSIPWWGCSFWASNRRPWAAALAAMAAAITLCLVVATVSAAAQFLPPGTTDVPIQRPRWADEQRRFWNVWTGLNVHLANIHRIYHTISLWFNNV